MTAAPRFPGVLLLVLVSALLAVATELASLGLRQVAPSPWPSVGLLLGSFWAAWALVSFRRPGGDPALLPLVAFLCSLGWVMVYRLVPDLGSRQALWIAVGFAVFVATVHLLRDYRVLEDYKYVCLVGGVVLQVAVMLFGVEINGARLWFQVGPVFFQPVEIVKVLVVVFLAAFLRQFRDWIRLGLRTPEGHLPRRALLILASGWAAAEGVLVLQKDLGMALLLFGVFVALFYISTGRTDLVSGAGALALAGGWACYHLFGHVRTRVDVWWRPFDDPQGGGYQMCQALYALAAGGVDGTGLGLGSPGLVPEAYTDFIFVALAEELGLVGAMGVVAVFMALITRLFRISLRAPDDFGTLLAAGLATLLAWQTLIILGGTVKLAPMTGITLPFMSYGGSSMVANFLILGVMWRISEAGEAEP